MNATRKQHDSEPELQTTEASIYDFPAYYDLIFGSDWAHEFHFLRAAFQKHVTGDTQRLLEPACGTGRLMFRFAKADYECDGIDLNDKAVEYCNKRMKKHSLSGQAFVADMSRFGLKDLSAKRKYDAAFNTINSFRHLPDERSARGHLECMATAIRKGGIYALGLHLTPTKGPTTDEEAWSARRGNLVVNTRMWPKCKNPRKRTEEFHMQFHVCKSSGIRVIDDVLKLRSYTAKQMQHLIDSVPQWEIASVYDFRYSIQAPIQIDEFTEDVVYILKRV